MRDLWLLEGGDQAADHVLLSEASGSVCCKSTRLAKTQLVYRVGKRPCPTAKWLGGVCVRSFGGDCQAKTFRGGY